MVGAGDLWLWPCGWSDRTRRRCQAQGLSGGLWDAFPIPSSSLPSASWLLIPAGSHDYSRQHRQKMSLLWRNLAVKSLVKWRTLTCLGYKPAGTEQFLKQTARTQTPLSWTIPSPRLGAPFSPELGFLRGVSVIWEFVRKAAFLDPGQNYRLQGPVRAQSPEIIGQWLFPL